LGVQPPRIQQCRNVLPLVTIHEGLMLTIKPLKYYEMLLKVFLSTSCSLILRIHDPMGYKHVMLGETSPQLSYQMNGSGYTCHTFG
jgi:hypothetical protein